MASGPGEAALGVAVLGTGIILIYAGYKDVPVLGPDGILTSAFTTGKLPSAPPPKQSQQNATPNTPPRQDFNNGPMMPNYQPPGQREGA